MLCNAVQTLDPAPEEQEAVFDVKKLKGSKSLFPQGPSKPEVIPFLDAFQRILEMEWNTPLQLRHVSRMVDKMYTLPDKVMQLLKVDVPVAAISSNAVLPSWGGEGPEVSCDKKVDSFSKTNFEVHLQAFQTSTQLWPIQPFPGQSSWHSLNQTFLNKQRTV